MKNLLISFLMCLMVWTVIGKDFDSRSGVYYILENEKGTRKLVMSYYDYENPIIVGDKVKIIKSNWKYFNLQRVK